MLVNLRTLMDTTPLQAGWKTLFDMGKTSGGRSSIAEALRLCPDSAPKSEDDVLALAYWLQDAWDYLAMGDCACG